MNPDEIPSSPRPPERAAAPLRNPAAAAHLGPAQEEVLAAVLAANGDRSK